MHYRNSNNKRSFDVAFLAGTFQSNLDENAAIVQSNDENRKNSTEKFESKTYKTSSYDDKISLDSSAPRSAFKKVCKQQSNLGGAMRDNHDGGIKERDPHTNTDLRRPIQPVVKKLDDLIENNNKSNHVKNDDLNHLISPMREITKVANIENKY